MAKKTKRIVDEEVTATSADFADSNFMLMDGSEGSKKVPMDLFATKTQVNAGLAEKQDTISDLVTIRSGAAKGATAVQPGDLSEVATSGSYDDLSNKPTIPAAQVNSDWNATSGVAQILNNPTIPIITTVELT